MPDEKVLKYFLKEAPNLEIHDNPEILQMLWECCQIPDFVKKTYGHHFEVVSKIFNFLTSRNKKVPNQYMKDQLSLLDKLGGNVDRYQIELQMSELGRTYQTSLIGLKIKTG